MNKIHSLYYIDIDSKVNSCAQNWIDKAGLTSYVKLSINDSSALVEPELAETYLQGAPQLIFIDSSHQYKHTLRELELWFSRLVPGGFIVLHDTSIFAKSFYTTDSGGVGEAVDEWTSKNHIQKINISGFVSGERHSDYPYLDGCGLTKIQENG